MQSIHLQNRPREIEHMIEGSLLLVLEDCLASEFVVVSDAVEVDIDVLFG